jgi:hypothetical protein
MTPDWSKNPQGVPYADFGNPQSLNLYSYVRNNPVAGTDPDGHCDPSNPGCALTVIQAINQFAANPGGYVEAFLGGAGKAEWSNDQKQRWLAIITESIK